MTPHQFVEGLLDRIVASEWTLSSEFAQRLAGLVGGTFGTAKPLSSGGETIVINASPYNWRVRTNREETAAARASLSFDFSDDHGSDSAAKKAAGTTFRKCAASITKKLGTPLAMTETEQDGGNAAQLELLQWRLRDGVVLLELKHEDRELPYEVAFSLRWSRTRPSRLPLPKMPNAK